MLIDFKYVAPGEKEFAPKGGQISRLPARNASQGGASRTYRPARWLPSTARRCPAKVFAIIDFPGWRSGAGVSVKNFPVHGLATVGAIHKCSHGNRTPLTHWYAPKPGNNPRVFSESRNGFVRPSESSARR